MSQTLEQILQDVNSTMDLEAATPSGDELEVRQNYANQALRDAADIGQFKEFKREYVVATSTLATIPMPADFRELMQDPQLLESSGTYRTYREIKLENKYDQDLGEDFCYILGDAQSGFNLVFNNLAVGATLHIPYQRFVNGMGSLGDKCELSASTFVVRKVESYVLYSRGDERFPTAEQRAQQTLLNASGREMKSPGGQGQDTKSKFSNPLR